MALLAGWKEQCWQVWGGGEGGAFATTTYKFHSTSHWGICPLSVPHGGGGGLSWNLRVREGNGGVEGIKNERKMSRGYTVKNSAFLAVPRILAFLKMGNILPSLHIFFV
jgi:hypothetical protein